MCSGMEDTGDEYMTNDLPMLQLQDLVDAVSGTAAALRCRTRLQPAGGAGDKVFPPTYAGAVYAIEHRRVPIKNDDRADSFETVPCVLLDSVQSQANRMEEALQSALDDGRVRIPVVNVDFSSFYPGLERDESLRLPDAIGVVTSLQLPHRIADAILRESLIGGTAFRQSPTGRLIDTSSARTSLPTRPSDLRNPTYRRPKQSDIV